MKSGPECYGGLFPDLAHMRYREECRGRAFSTMISSPGTGPHGRRLQLDRDAWDECVQCPDHQTCYELSLATLMMNQTLVNTELANPWVGVGPG